jgi:MarR family transcriptional regulator, organic hydroperoxide resistance regulator
MDEMRKSLVIIKMLKQLTDTVKQSMHEQFKEMRVTGPQGMLMHTLVHNGKMKISDLSEMLALSNSTVSGILDRLEKHGFVERSRSEEDRRVVYVNVTDEFRKHAQEHFEEIEKKLESMMNKATQDELDKITMGLETLQKVITRQQE